MSGVLRTGEWLGFEAFITEGLRLLVGRHQGLPCSDWPQQEDGAKSPHLNKSVLGVALGEHSKASGGAAAWLCTPVFRDQPWHHQCARTSVESQRQDIRQPVSPVARCTLQCAPGRAGPGGPTREAAGKKAGGVRQSQTRA